jgi:hypothetical protein
MASERKYSGLGFRVNRDVAALVSSHTRHQATPPSLAPSHTPTPLWRVPGRSIDHLEQKRYQSAPPQLTMGYGRAHRGPMVVW